MVFEILPAKYSMAYDLTPYHAKGRDYLLSLVKAAVKYPTKENIFKVISLREDISVFKSHDLRDSKES